MSPSSSANLLNITQGQHQVDALVRILSELQTLAHQQAVAVAHIETEIAALRRDVSAIKETIASHESRIGSLETSRSEVRGGYNLAHVFLSLMGGGGIVGLISWALSK